MPEPRVDIIEAVDSSKGGFGTGEEGCVHRRIMLLMYSGASRLALRNDDVAEALVWTSHPPLFSTCSFSFIPILT